MYSSLQMNPNIINLQNQLIQQQSLNLMNQFPNSFTQFPQLINNQSTLPQMYFQPHPTQFQQQQPQLIQQNQNMEQQNQKPFFKPIILIQKDNNPAISENMVQQPQQKNLENSKKNNNKGFQKCSFNTQKQFAFQRCQPEDNTNDIISNGFKMSQQNTLNILQDSCGSSCSLNNNNLKGQQFPVKIDYHNNSTEESNGAVEKKKNQNKLGITKKISKDQQQQNKKPKQFLKIKKDVKRINTSHVPLNMFNQLYFHLQNLYLNKFECKCQKETQQKIEEEDIRVSVKKEESSNSLDQDEKQSELEQKSQNILSSNKNMEKQQILSSLDSQDNEEDNNTDNISQNDKIKQQDIFQIKQGLCQKCSEWEKIQIIKKMKKKNIETFRILWGIGKRVQVLSENFFLRNATISILNNKMYRTTESKEAVYQCLPNFVLGSRNYQTFYRILN